MRTTAARVERIRLRPASDYPRDRERRHSRGRLVHVDGSNATRLSAGWNLVESLASLYRVMTSAGNRQSPRQAVTLAASAVSR
jgi:hypothetical protein